MGVARDAAGPGSPHEIPVISNYEEGALDNKLEMSKYSDLRQQMLRNNKVYHYISKSKEKVRIGPILVITHTFKFKL